MQLYIKTISDGNVPETQYDRGFHAINNVHNANESPEMWEKQSSEIRKSQLCLKSEQSSRVKGDILSPRGLKKRVVTRNQDY